MGGSSPAPTQTTTTTISPQAQQLFNLAYPSLANYAANPPPSRYPSSTVAGFTPTQEAAQSAATAGAAGQAGIASNAANLAAAIPGMLDWSSTALPGAGSYTPPSGIGPGTVPMSSNIFNDPGIWNPAYNTGLSNAITAAQRPTWQALTEQALPAIRQNAVAQGPFGGTREGLAEGLATSRANQQALDIASKMTEDVYGQNLQASNNRYNANLQALMQQYGIDRNTAVALANMGVTARGQDISAAGQRYGQDLSALYQTLGLTPQLQSAFTAPAATLGAVGDAQQQMNQAQLNDAINAYYYSEYAPYLQARDILGLIPSIPGASTTATGSVPQANTATTALGGAATGAALGSLVPIPGATLAGAGAGALLPFLFR
jgi:hypothetical protein